MDIKDDDLQILRDLAKRVAEIGNDPVQQEKAQMWTRHNDLDPVRPMILIFPEGSWRELLPDSALETSEDCPLRSLEWGLRHRIYYAQHMQDDTVIEPNIVCPLVINNTGWGLDIDVTHSENATGADHFESVIDDMSDLEKIQSPTVTVDWEASRRRFEEYQELFGDIIEVELRGRAGARCSPMDTFAKWRGLDRIFMDLIDNPELVHEGMRRIMDGVLGELRQLEEQNALSLDNRKHYSGSGGTGYTNELPQNDFDGEHVRLCDIWGFATAQIFSEVSPQMHEEFALQHEMRLLEKTGLNAYGCCEPLHNKLDLVKNIPNIRRISISPWADVEQSAEELQDQYIYSWKPNPAIIAGEQWDPEHARKVIRNFLRKTEGCVVEMIMKDTHTCRHEPERMWEWTRIAREEVGRFMDGQR